MQGVEGTFNEEYDVSSVDRAIEAQELAQGKPQQGCALNYRLLLQCTLILGAVLGQYEKSHDQ